MTYVSLYEQDTMSICLLFSFHIAAKILKNFSFEIKSSEMLVPHIKVWRSLYGNELVFLKNIFYVIFVLVGLSSQWCSDNYVHNFFRLKESPSWNLYSLICFYAHCARVILWFFVCSSFNRLLLSHIHFLVSGLTGFGSPTLLYMRFFNVFRL